MNNHKNIGKGMIAGLVATIALSLVMLMKQTMSVMPELDPIQMITQMMGAQTPLIGWAIHFMIGTILWGIAYAIIDPRLSGRHALRGVIFATAAWLLMMVMVMPMAGAGLFGLKLGVMAPVATLMMHWVYGAVLGGVYGALIAHQRPVNMAHANQ